MVLCNQQMLTSIYLTVRFHPPTKKEKTLLITNICCGIMLGISPMTQPLRKPLLLTERLTAQSPRHNQVKRTFWPFYFFSLKRKYCIMYNGSDWYCARQILSFNLFTSNTILYTNFTKFYIF